MTLTALKSHRLSNEIVVARNGAEALDYLYRRNGHAARPEGLPALVLLDIKMPLVDGLEVLRQIKQDEQMRSIPVVMLTSSREESDLVKSYRLGINAYVVKPVEFTAFADAVSQLSVFWTIHNEVPPRNGAHHPGPIPPSS